MKILGATQKNSTHKMFLHKRVLHYVRTLKLNDATLASLGRLKPGTFAQLVRMLRASYNSNDANNPTNISKFLNLTIN